MSEFSLKHKVQNDSAATVQLILEPWANEFAIPSGSSFCITVQARTLGAIETIMTDEFHIVWLWSGCTARVSLDGMDLTPRELSIPAFG